MSLTAEVVPKLLPVMQVGMHALSVFNGVAGVARMFGAPVPSVPADWQRGAQKLMLFQRAGLFKGGSKMAARQSPPNTTTPAAREEAAPVLRLNSERTLHVRNIAGDTPVSHGSEKTFEQYRFRSTSTAGQKLLSCWLRLCYVLRARSA